MFASKNAPRGKTARPRGRGPRPVAQQSDNFESLEQSEAVQETA